jgi:biopolymer transport protein ExbD
MILEKLHHENPKGSLVIQADANSTNQALVVVMEAAKQAGIANVAVSAADD